MLYDLCIALFGHFLDYVLVRAHDHHRWPVVQILRVPDIEVTIIAADVLDVISTHRLPQHIESFFCLEFRGVDPNEGYLRHICKHLLEFLQLGEHMDTVDAARGPEVNNQKLVLEVFVTS